MTFRSLGLEILTPRGSIAKLVAPAHVSIRPVAIGAEAEIEVFESAGVAREHLFILLREGQLFVSAAAPAHVGSLTLPGSWTALDVPCRIDIGEATVRLFWCSPRRTTTPIPPPPLESRPKLPPMRLPPRVTPVPRPPTKEERQEALLREDDTTAARPNQEDEDPTHRRIDTSPTPVHAITPIPRFFVPTPPGGSPFQSPTPTPIASAPPPPPTPSSLFKIATKAVDAWNRWVDEIDHQNKR